MFQFTLKHHMIFWLGLVVLTVAVLSPYYFNLTKAIMHRLVFIPVWFLATYLNLELLLPRLWDQEKKVTYALSLVALILVLTVLQRLFCIHLIYPTFFWMRPPTEQELNPFWIGPFIQFAIFISLPVFLSTGFRAARNWYNESVVARQAVAEQQEAELSYLKAQVNPHFLFNNLNSLYGLSLEFSKRVPELILKLSDLLSYSLYESEVESVSLGKELKLVEDFIALERERYGERVNIDLKKDGELNPEVRIAPLLLLPLIENAFKHGVKNSTLETRILIEVKTEGSSLHFKMKNEVHEGQERDQQGGVGLENLRRRLLLTYPERHSFQVENKAGWFTVDLKLQLDG